MFLRKSGKARVNEINTIPGFTRISMYPKLLETSGISPVELIERHRTGQGLETTP